MFLVDFAMCLHFPAFMRYAFNMPRLLLQKQLLRDWMMQDPCVACIANVCNLQQICSITAALTDRHLPVFAAQPVPELELTASHVLVLR